jgi:hypothetical protein
MRAINMGAQVDSEDLVTRAIEEQADVILVSQVVTQKNIHLDNLTRLSDMLEAEGLRERIILVVGGPRISHELAKELGYDAGFGVGSYAEDVASFRHPRMDAAPRSCHMQRAPHDMPHHQPDPPAHGRARRPLRRRPGGRRQDAATVWRRGHRTADPQRRRRRPVRGLRQRRVPGPGACGRLHRSHVGTSSAWARVLAQDGVRGAQGHRLGAQVPGQPSAADVLAEPVLVCRASGTCVVPTWTASASRSALKRRHGQAHHHRRADRCRGRPAQQPALPITPEEIGIAAAECVAAGAAIVHLHGRLADGTPTQDAEVYREIIEEVRAALRRDRAGLHRRRRGHDAAERLAPVALRPRWPRCRWAR